MSIEIGTYSDTGVNSMLRRIGTTPGTDIMDNKTAEYTVMFRLYVPDSNPVQDIIWALGNNQTGSPTAILDRSADALAMNASGLIVGTQSNGATGGNSPGGTTDFTTGWYTVVFQRATNNNINIRTRIGTAAAPMGSWASSPAFVVSTRPEASLFEYIFGDTGSGHNMAVGAKVMNYKSWTAYLLGTELVLEDLTTAVTRTSNLFSVSPMTDTTTLANNLTATGPGGGSIALWTAGSGLIAGANDPAVTIAGGSSVGAAAYHYSQQ